MRGPYKPSAIWNHPPLSLAGLFDIVRAIVKHFLPCYLATLLDTFLCLEYPLLVSIELVICDISTDLRPFIRILRKLSSKI